MNTSIIIQNLKCSGCANTILAKLSEIENISDVKVEVEASSVSFDFKRTKDIVLVKERLRRLGYPSVDDQNTLAFQAMSFVSCALGKMSKP